MSKRDDTRCPWCLATPLYIDYHDTEWGVPCRDDQALFEMLNLEGAQAGLSWITILNKREGYRRLFKGFDANAIVRFKTRDIDRIVINPDIVRHRGKIEAVVGNARAFLALRDEGNSLSDFVWDFVDGEPLQNTPASMADVAGSTPQSIALSKALKKRGFKFVGPTIAYAFMQAAGLVNDHLDGCPRQAECAALAGTG